jgi:putative ABC transport system permease protein
MRGESLPDFTFHVDGVIAKTDGVTFSDDVNVHLRYFRQWAHTDSAAVILVQVRQAMQTDAIAYALEQKLANSATPVSTQSFKSLLQGLAQRLADVNTLTFVIIAASLFGLFLICFNTTAHSVAERIGEFALLKAIGFTPPRLLWLVFFETFLAIVPAAAVGVLAAVLVVGAFAGPKLNLPGIMLTPAALAETMIIAVGLAVLSSVLPGLRIVRLNCGEILRKG